MIPLKKFSASAAHARIAAKTGPIQGVHPKEKKIPAKKDFITPGP